MHMKGNNLEFFSFSQNSQKSNLQVIHLIKNIFNIIHIGLTIFDWLTLKGCHHATVKLYIMTNLNRCAQNSFETIVTVASLLLAVACSIFADQ